MSSFWNIFRLIYVIFSLYLVGDALFRWDGFRYYAPFSEFLPSVALITIIWSIVAVFSSLLVWVFFQVIIWCCRRMGWKVTVDHGLIFLLGIIVILIPTIWIAKRYLPGGNTLYTVINTAVFLSVLLLPILIWLFRNKTDQWMRIIQERISPLVWLFFIITSLSVPLVSYHVLWEKTDDVMLEKKALPIKTKKNRPNIILLTFDALSARNMSVYNYERSTTPFMEEWAKEASLFTRLEAESVITTPTIASLMTGKRLWTHQVYHLKGTKPKKVDTENLPLLLKYYGYSTMAFVVNPLASVNALGVENGFDIAPIPTQFHGPTSLFGHFDRALYQLFGEKIRLHDWIIQGDFIPYKILIKLLGDRFKTAWPPNNAFNKLLRVVDENTQEPFFAWIHVFPPHSPYLPPKPYMGMFNSSSKLRSFASQDVINEIALVNNDTFQEFPVDAISDINVLKSRYDEFIRYCDKEFQYFIAELEKRNILKNTIIILSSDHGESFEHGVIEHNSIHLYEQVTNIPLIIKEPHQTEKVIINDIVEQIDIPASILDLADIPIPAWMEGRSLVPLMHGKSISSRPAFSMSLMHNPSQTEQIKKGTIAVWDGDYKLIHYLDKNKNLLFNLRQDPEEIHNLFDTETEISHHLLSLIKENLKKANQNE